MRVRWMLAILAAVLVVAGSVAAAAHESLVLFGAITGLILWFAAVVIAGVAVGLVALVWGSRPSRPVIGAVLAVAGLLVFPVHRSFYEEREWAEAGGGVGHCSGIVPLAEAWRLDRSALQYTPVGLAFGCDD